MAVLCVNTGSSSIKLATFDGERATARIAIDGVRDHIAALAGALASVAEPEVVVHRIVHGGDAHVAPAIVDAPLIASLEQLVPLAPLHLPLALAGIAAVFERWPAVPQVACFDTAFHARLPELARRLPLPGTLGVRRYGFHGLSYEYVSGVLAPLPPRCVLAHLGSGASLVALRDGAPIDTTMGLTPTGGIAMATRTGDLDPGVLIYLAREKRMTIDQLERAVEREGGLVAIAGTGDMKALLQRRDADARLAVELFAYGVRKAIGGYAAALGGLDLLAFSGGIGEHAPEVRALACSGLGFLGIELDEARNRRNDAAIHRGACAVRVVPTDEDLMMARHARALVAAER